jgi:hypothetical protein
MPADGMSAAVRNNEDSALPAAAARHQTYPSFLTIESLADRRVPACERTPLRRSTKPRQASKPSKIRDVSPGIGPPQ